MTLLVGTEHQIPHGRIQIEPDDVPEFLLKVRIIGDLKSLQPMWLYFVMAPNALYCALAHLGFALHRAHAPSDSTLRRSSRSFNDQRDFILRTARFTASSSLIRHSRYSLL